MSEGGDWIDEMVKRGLLTAEQAGEARKQPGSVGGGETSAAVPAPNDAAAPPEPVAPPPPDGAPGIFACAACSKVYTIHGGDALHPPPCPECRGSLRSVQLGSLVPTTSASTVSPGGQPFGRYFLQREIGRGGMGIVFEAFDTLLDRPVALKMLSAPGKELDAAAVERLLREARAAGKLRHPGITAVHDVGQAEGRHYFTMDLIEGTSLERLLASERSATDFPVRRRVEILAAVAEALGFAHAAGIVHRDVKPPNIIVGPQGQATLVDFGLARDAALADGPTATGSLLGTLHYMSPEQAGRGARLAGPPSDVFSLGVILYRALTGVLPFQGDEAQTLIATIQDEPVPPSKRDSGVSRDLQTICLKCLEKDPKARYANGAAVAADLRRWLAGEPIEATAVSWVTRLWRKVTRRQPSGATREDLAKIEAEHSKALESAKAQTEATKLLEQARPALDRAWRIQYDPKSTQDALVSRVDAAQSLIEKALEKSPELALGHYLLGRGLALKGLDLQAEAAWRKAIHLDPDFGPAHYQLGSLLVEQAWLLKAVNLSQDVPGRAAQRSQFRSKEAASEIQRSLVLGSGFDEAPQKLIAQAMAALTAQDKDEVKRLCLKGIQDFPNSEGRETFYCLLGAVEVPGEKMRCFNKAIEIRPRFALALALRGVGHHLLEKFAEAHADFNAALLLKPTLMIARIGRGYLLEQRGDYAAALADYSAAVEIEPESPDAWIHRSEVKGYLGDSQGTLEDLTRAIELAPRNANFLANRASIKTDLGDPAGAILDCDAALAIDPACEAAWSQRGLAKWKLEDLAGALADSAEAVRIAPKSPVTLGNRGNLKRQCRDFAGAIADLTEALRWTPGHGMILCCLAEARLGAGDTAGAIADCEAALAGHAQNPMALAVRGRARFFAGDAAGAIRDLTESIGFAPTQPDAWLFRSQARARAGDTVGALADARQAVKAALPGWERRTEAEKTLQALLQA